MKTSNEQEFINKAHVFFAFAEDAKWQEEDVDKTEFWNKLYEFAAETDKAAVSKDFKYRSYNYAFRLLHFHDDGLHNTFACDLLAKKAQNSPKDNDAELKSMALLACIYGRQVHYPAKEEVLYNIYQSLENKDDYNYKKEVKSYSYYMKKQKRANKQIVANKKISEIDYKIKSESSPHKRVELLEEKLKLIKADAFGRAKSFEMRERVCSDILKIYRGELPYLTDKIIYYEDLKKKFEFNKENTLLHSSQSDNQALKNQHIEKFSGYKR